MDLSWIEDFLCLATVGTFSKAAEARHVTQSALSRRIKGLEAWLGYPLFDRSTVPVRLTERGERFAGDAKGILATMSKHRSSAMRCETGEIPARVTALHTVALSFFPTWYQEMQASFSNKLHVELQALDFPDCLLALRDDRAELCLTFTHPDIAVSPALRDNWASTYLGKDQLVLAGKPVFKDAVQSANIPSGEQIPYLGYSPECFLSRYAEFAWKKMRNTPKLSLCVESSMAECLKNMVLSGIGIAWLPYSSIASDIEKGNLAQLHDERHDLEIRLFRAPQTLSFAAEHIWTQAKNNSEEIA